jgi:hypothetical protein
MGFFDNQKQKPFVDFIGRGINLDKRAPFATLRPCQCGGMQARVGEGKGPHIASLRCLNCSQMRWLSEGAAICVRTCFPEDAGR